MEDIVLNSNIAHMVLGYLKNQKFRRAAHVFSKASPHLKHEKGKPKHGRLAQMNFGDLEEIVREYIVITRIVDSVSIVLSSTDSWRWQLQQCKLSDKISDLLEHAVQLLEERNYADRHTCTCKQNSEQCDISADANKNEQDKSKLTKETSKKRKRTHQMSSSSTLMDTLSIGSTKLAKRRRLVDPYSFAITRYRGRFNAFKSAIHSQFGSASESVTSGEDSYTTSDEEPAEMDDTTLGLEKPTRESTPRCRSTNKMEKFQTPSLPEISQVILSNEEFQTRLVRNINEALNTVSAPSSMNSDDFLNQMVKNIIEATEKDPSYDKIIEEVALTTVTSVDDANKNELTGATTNSNDNTEQQTITDAIQSNINVADSVDVTNEYQTSTNSKQFPSTSTETFSEKSNLSAPPQTPLIIRSAVATAAAFAAAPDDCNDAQTGNASFTSLIDPNFSISKLIVVNSNDSAQKQHQQTYDPDGTFANAIGNITADNIINQIGNHGEVLTNLDDQVCFDATTGQLSFPIILTNDGLLANFPFLINNELVTQQLRPESMAGLEVSRLEIPLPEPIIVTANQLPPNSIIFNSTQKHPPAELLNQIKNTGTEARSEPQRPTTAVSLSEQRENQLQRTSSKLQIQNDASICTAAPTSLDSSRIQTERVTPSTSGIVNVKAYRSLSTPRKRVTHVRTLNFSPKTCVPPPIMMPSGETPLSTRRDQPMSRIPDVPVQIPSAKNDQSPTDQAAIDDEPPEKVIISNVEILPSYVGNDISGNESSNSCSVPPLFLTEECSNQTVIKAKSNQEQQQDTQNSDVGTDLLASSPTVTELVSVTPKRKPKRTAVEACKRRLSKSATENDNEPGQCKENQPVMAKNPTVGECCEATKENQQEQQAKQETKTKLKVMDETVWAEWQKMRSNTTTELESRLREINAMAGTNRRVATKNRRSRRKKVEKDSLKKTKRTITSKRNNNDNVNNEKDNSANRLSDDEVDDVESLKNTAKVVFKNKDKGQGDNIKATIKTKEFKIKITPQKQRTESSKKLMNCFKPIKFKKSKSIPLSPNLLPHPPASNALESSNELYQRKDDDSKECEKRTANIACLLDTPFKDPNISVSDLIPPTPGIFSTVPDTPQSRPQPSDQEFLHTTSFLFGSLTKSEIDTPMLSAITPGLRFTPFSNMQQTPRSAAKTEYSSGSSYYRPDESEDVDNNIERMLRDSGKKQKQLDDEQQLLQQVEIFKDSISVKLPVEKLRVEPTVLKRVKSFGNEALDGDEPNPMYAVSSTATTNIDPHYTLVSGLPDCTTELSSPSSSSSSSTSSSSSSSSNRSRSSFSSSSSTSVTTSTKLSPKHTVANTSEQSLSGHKTPTDAVNNSLSLENLSEISSTEDEEWQKLENNFEVDEQQAQLINDNGEVRYPLRNWLTPSKERHDEGTASNMSSKSSEKRPLATITLKLPLKSAEKFNRHTLDLAQKRERVKQKFKNDGPPLVVVQKAVAAAAQTAANKLATRQKLQALRAKMLEKAVVGGTGGNEGGHEVAKLNDTKINSGIVRLNKPQILNTNVEEEQRTIDVLTALNLSAKKQPPTGVKGGETMTKALITQRKCVQIEAQPAPRRKPKTTGASTKSLAKTAMKYKKAIKQTSPLKLPITPRTSKSRACKLKQKIVEEPPASPEESAKLKKLKKKPPTKSVKKNKALLSEAKASNETDNPCDIEAKILEQADGNETTKQEAAKSVASTKSPDAAPLTPKKSYTKKPIKSSGDNIKQRESNNTCQDKPKNGSTAATPELNNEERPKGLCIKTATTDVTTIAKVQETAAIVESIAINHVTTATELTTSAEHNLNNDNFILDTATSDENEKYCYNIAHFDAYEDDVEVQQQVNHYTPQDFTNFAMCIEIDENETHIMRISNVFCLYDAKPSTAEPNSPTSVVSTIRNIPKKRRIRITTSVSDDATATTMTSTDTCAVDQSANNVASGIAQSTNATAMTTITAAAADPIGKIAVKESGHNTNKTEGVTVGTSFVKCEPTATSTPLAIVARTTQTRINETNESEQKSENIKDTESTTTTTKAFIDVNKISETSSASSLSVSKNIAGQQEPAVSTQPLASGNNSNVRIEDIESILSHLHGI